MIRTITHTSQLPTSEISFIILDITNLLAAKKKLMVIQKEQIFNSKTELQYNLSFANLSSNPNGTRLASKKKLENASNYSIRETRTTLMLPISSKYYPTSLNSQSQSRIFKSLLMSVAATKMARVTFNLEILPDYTFHNDLCALSDLVIFKKQIYLCNLNIIYLLCKLFELHRIVILFLL